MFPIRDVNPTFIRPVLTWIVVAVNIGVFFFVQPQSGFDADEFVYRNAAIACELTTGEPLTSHEVATGVCTDSPGSVVLFPEKSLLGSVVLSMFLHTGVMHLVLNMWILWIFGNNVEEAFGRRGFVIMYLLSGAAATLGFVALRPDLTVPLVGASGAIAGVMGAYLVLFPRHRVMTLIIFRIVAIPARVFLGIWFISQFLFTGGNVAVEAHVAGFLFGVLITLPLRRRLLRNTSGRSPLRTR